MVSHLNRRPTILLSLRFYNLLQVLSLLLSFFIRKGKQFMSLYVSLSSYLYFDYMPVTRLDAFVVSEICIVFFSHRVNGQFRFTYKLHNVLLRAPLTWPPPKKKIVPASKCHINLNIQQHYLFQRCTSGMSHTLHQNSRD